MLVYSKFLRVFALIGVLTFAACSDQKESLIEEVSSTEPEMQELYTLPLDWESLSAEARAEVIAEMAKRTTDDLFADEGFDGEWLEVGERQEYRLEITDNKLVLSKGEKVKEE